MRGVRSGQAALRPPELLAADPFFELPGIAREQHGQIASGVVLRRPRSLSETTDAMREHKSLSQNGYGGL